MDTLLQDIRISLRRLMRSRGFATIAISTLAIGIGANTAVFTLVNAIQLRPLPFVRSDRLVDVYENNPVEVCAGCGVGTSYANFLDWQRTARSFASIAAYDEVTASVALNEGAQKRYVGRVSAELFPLLGVAPVRGRFFTVEEEHASGARVALISAAVATAAFGADVDPVGKIARVDGEAFQIVGVLPESFALPEHADLWLPLAPVAANKPRNERSIGVVARLEDGVSLEQAAAEMTTIGRQAAIQFQAEQKGWDTFVTSLHADLVSDYRDMNTPLLAAVSCVLLIACANLANLMLARASRRRAEFGVRAALGATPMQLARQVLVETLLVSIAGGLFGLIVATWGIELIRTTIGAGLPRWIRYDMDWRVFLYALGVSLFTGVAFGLLPARHASRASVNDALKEGGRSTTGGRTTGRARNTLVVLQMALAIVLVVSAGLLSKAMLRSGEFDMGYDLSNLLQASIGATGPRYQDPQAVVTFADRLLAELKRGTAVKAVAVKGLHIVNWPGTPVQKITIDNVPDDKAATALHHINTVTPAYFETLGLPLLSGRGFTESDVRGSPLVAIISKTLAYTLWGDAQPLGRHIRIGNDDWTVVGVAGDMRESPFGQGWSPLLYMPLAQHPVNQPTGQALSLSMRVLPSAVGTAQLLRHAIASVDPDVTTESVMTMEESLSQWQKPARMIALLSAALGAFACLLAAIGIYGVIAYLVTQRTHEIGIRMALGASSHDAMQLVLRHGLVLGVAGAVIGMAASFEFTKLLRTMLFGVSSADPVVYTLVATGFLVLALLASWLPARRATRIDPMEALRAE